MSERRAWGRYVLFIVVACGFAVLATQLEWVEEDVRTGYSREARRNPYLALERLLRESGHTVTRIEDAAQLKTLSTHATLLLTSDTLVMHPELASRLVAWVQAGGHLLLPVVRGQSNHLAEPLGIRNIGFVKTTASDTPLDVESHHLRVAMRFQPVFHANGEVVWSSELEGTLAGRKPRHAASDASADDESDDEDDKNISRGDAPFSVDDAQQIPPAEREHYMAYARLHVGKGFVTVGNTTPITNPHIERYDHARLALHLSTLPNDRRPIYILLSSDYPDLASWLFSHAPMALLASFTLLLASIWRKAIRFGPRIDLPPAQRPGLREHLAAVGRFLQREQEFEALISALREEVTQLLVQLRSRHPEIDALPALAVRLSGLNANDIHAALSPAPANAQDFQRRCRTLMQLRRICLEHSS